MARRLSVTRLVWLAARSSDGALVLTATLFDQRGAALAKRRVKGVADREALVKAASLVIQLLDPPRAQSPRVSSEVLSSGAPRGVRADPLPRGAPLSRDTPRRWYKTWWVWTAVGVVLVGAGVGIAVAAQGDAARPQPSAMDIEFTF